MPNELTGDFDVVAEFALPAVNRLLAAMHRIERFPHSMALRVDDDPPPGGKVDRPTIVEAVDAFGEPPADHTKIGFPIPVSGVSLGADPRASVLDPIVNPDVVGANVGPLVPSRLRGTAQLQVSPPTLRLAAGGGNSVTVRLQIRARYFPDPQTTRVAEFVHGELRLTAAVNQVASQTANVIDIDIKANTLQIAFAPTWSSQPLTAENIAGIEQLIRNALKTSFLPASIALPAGVMAMQFKSVPAGAGAIAVLLKMTPGAGNPASVTNVFLGGGDHFAFAAGIDFVRAQFQPTLDAILAAPPAPVEFDKKILWHTFHIVYTVTLTGAAVNLEGGKIVLRIDGHAHTDRAWLPDFNFRTRVPFSLSPSGATAELVPEDVSIDITSGGITGWVVGLFKDNFKGQANQQRDDALVQTNARETVRTALSANVNFGGVLTSLLTPPDSRRVFVVLPPRFQLAYTAVEIRPSGIVLHGALAVLAWPPGHVEFEQVPANPGAGGAGGHALPPTGPDYSALKTWIPGGTIQRYEWSEQGQSQPFRTDEHTFVLIHAGPQLSDGMPSTAPAAGYVPLCLTVRGVRPSSSGPVVDQPISASVCGFTSFPIVGAIDVASNGVLPMVALTRPDARGMVEVAGHAAAVPAEGGRRRPNVIVHFADERTGDRLGLIVQALSEAGRQDATVAVVAVVPAERLTNTTYTPGIIYADDQGAAWEQVFGVKGIRRPLTLVVEPNGKVAWRHEGELERAALVAALRKSLVATGAVKRGMLRSALRIGQLPPNFLFEYAPGRQLTLRKLAGRPVILVFWKTASKPSIDAVRDLTRDATRAAGAVVLAINDGDAADVATRSAKEHALAATVVTDPRRAISLAYGVSLWPTIVEVDGAGLVRALRYGRA